MWPYKDENSVKVKKQYNTPHLVIYGDLEKITGGIFGPHNDLIQGNTNPGFCDPNRFKICPTGS